jgi:hypothetical protein
MLESWVYADTSSGSSGPRAELYTTSEFTEGLETYVGYLFEVPTQDPFISAGQHAIMQFKNDGSGSPPVDLDIRNFAQYGAATGGLYLTYSSGDTAGVLDAGLLLIPMADLMGVQHAICFHVVFSADKAVGFMEVWLDGVSVYSGNSKTLRDGLDSYLKVGLYGPSGLGDNTHVAYHAAVRYGTSRETVDPWLLYGMGDSTPPVVTITAGPTAAKISNQTGKDVSDVTFTVSEAYQAYELEVVADVGAVRGSGSLVESGGSGDGSARTVEVTFAELNSASAGNGPKLVKVFVQDLAGNWSG